MAKFSISSDPNWIDEQGVPDMVSIYKTMVCQGQGQGQFIKGMDNSCLI